MNLNKKFKRNKGITLIALVVTIIVLLILAGISISMLTGQNGILNRAVEAKEKTEVAQEDESVKMAVSSALIEGEGELTTENLQEAFTKSNLNGPLEGSGPWTYTGDYGEYDIEKSGNITTNEYTDDSIIKMLGDYGVTKKGKLVNIQLESEEYQVWSEATIGEEVEKIGKVKFAEGYNGSYYVINRDGEVYAWGNNGYGQLGIENTEYQSTPVKIDGVTNVEKIYVNDDSASVYAKTIKGEVYAWGNNGYGQLGIGNTEDQSSPVKIEGLANVKEIYVNNYYLGSAYAKTITGEVYAWGNNDMGQLGIGNTEDQSRPVKIEGIANVEKIWTDSHSAYAKTTNGEVYAWGNNYKGKLGTGNTEDQSAPIKINELANIENICVRL